ncbi:kelch-like protein 12 [Paramacrobiotus metropolitanus]|uniref:kelch-like protein 12 n=1 Tax=Paramacrobiotus metropolitanus TaxID=2943436 RepID=UPI002445BFF4|nr:kelch-like protein 12 [Paramacrobiotus metropolitanus]
MAEGALSTSQPPRKRARRSDNAPSRELDGSEFFAGLQESRHDFYDISVRGAEDPTKRIKSIPCHRNVLMARSGWFRTMLRSPGGSQQATIHLPNVSHAIVKQLIDYMYSCKVSIGNMSNALLLLQAADLLEMGQIVQVCTDFLLKNMDLANWLTIFRGTRQLSDKRVAEACLVFALENFVKISYSHDFLDLDAAELKQFVVSNKLNVEKEEQVAAAVVRWLGHSLPQRSRFAVGLGKCIRLPYLTAEYRASLPDTPAGQHVQQTLFAAANVAHRYRDSYRKEPVIVFLWGYNKQTKRTEKMDTVELYRLDPLTDSKCSVPCAVPPSSWSGPMVYVVKDGRLRICVLAEEDDLESCRLFVYAVDEDRWTDGGEFPVSNAWLTAIGDRIYMMGGDRELYAFDDEVRQLTAKAKMPIKLRASASVAHDGRLYLFGGRRWSSRSKRYCATTAAYCYDPARDVWENLAPMPTARYDCRACVGPDGLIYVVGGCASDLTYNAVTKGYFDGGGRCVEAYNVQTNLWQIKGSMKTGRSKMGLVWLEEKLYALAGFIGAWGGHLQTECYYTNTNRWLECEPAFSPQCDMHCAVVPRTIAWKNMQRFIPDDRD